MASPARFTFDLNLEQRLPRVAQATPVAVPSIPEDLVAELVANARREAFAEGLMEGERNATTMAAQTVAAAAATLATQTTEMLNALDAARDAHNREAIELALSIGRKLALHALARHPLVELEALVAECMPSLHGVPHLVIRCHPELAGAIRDAATAQMAASGFTGRLVVMGDPDIRVGDGRLEWVDGGIVRDLGDTAQQIDRQIATYFAARSRTGTKEHH